MEKALRAKTRARVIFFGPWAWLFPRIGAGRFAKHEPGERRRLAPLRDMTHGFNIR